MFEELRTIADLKDKGILSEAEFMTLKANILGLPKPVVPTVVATASPTINLRKEEAPVADTIPTVATTVPEQPITSTPIQVQTSPKATTSDANPPTASPVPTLRATVPPVQRPPSIYMPFGLAVIVSCIVGVLIVAAFLSSRNTPTPPHYQSPTSSHIPAPTRAQVAVFCQDVETEFRRNRARMLPNTRTRFKTLISNVKHLRDNYQSSEDTQNIKDLDSYNKEFRQLKSEY